MIEPRWTTKDLATFVQKSELTVRRWLREGVLPASCFHKDGRRIVVHPEAVRRHYGVEETKR